MNAGLESYICTIAVGGRNQSISFVDDIDLITGSNENHTDHTSRMTYYGMKKKYLNAVATRKGKRCIRDNINIWKDAA